MRFVLVALLAARAMVAADPAFDLVPPNTKVVVGFHVSAIVASPLFKDSGLGVGAPQMADDWFKLVSLMGFDPFRDIDEVILFSPADQTRASTQALLVVRGRFDPAHVGAGSTRYRGVPLVGGVGDGKSLLAMLDSSTVLAGDAAAVRAAIDRRGHVTPVDAKLAERVQSLRERFDVWGTGELPPGMGAPAGPAAELESIDRFEFGMRISKGLELSADVHARTPEDAAKLAAMLGMVKATAAVQGQALPLEVEAKDGTVKVSLTVSEEELKKAFAKGQQAAKAAQAGPPTISGSEPSAAPRTYNDGGGTGVVTLPGGKP